MYNYKRQVSDLSAQMLASGGVTCWLAETKKKQQKLKKKKGFDKIDQKNKKNMHMALDLPTLPLIDAYSTKAICENK